MSDVLIISSILLITVILIITLIEITIKKVGNIINDVTTLRSEVNSLYHTLIDYKSEIDKRLRDMSNDIDQLSDKVLKIESGMLTRRKTRLEKEYKKETKVEIGERIKEGKKLTLTRTQQIILDKLKEGPKTYKDIQVETGLSREHIARELKKLYEMGLLERDITVKPYMYTLKKEIIKE